LKFCDLALVDAFSNCRALAKCPCRKLCIFLVLQTPSKERLHQRGTMCLRGTERRGQAWPHGTATHHECMKLFAGSRVSGRRTAAFFEGAHFMAIAFQVAV
jgi:hypothetical protein